MIEYLEQLVEEKKYREALDLAEQLMKQADDPHQVVRIYAARVVSYCRLGEEQAALAGGDFAMNLAKELGDWDSFGIMALYVGAAYSRRGQLNEAINRMYEFLGCINQYQKVSVYESTAWFNLGTWQVALSQPLEGTRALSNALKAAQRAGDHRFAHGVRQALIDAYLRVGMYDPVPRLLAQCGRYLRHYGGSKTYEISWAYYVQLRSEYALATGRMDRAMMLATRALHWAEGEPAYEFLAHVILAKVALRRGSAAEALGHGLSARTWAVLSRRSDLEAEVSELLYRITQAFPGAIEMVEQHYAVGLS